MPRDFSLDSVGDMLDGLKSRLGFTREDDDYESDEYGDYDYDEYGDYGDGGDEAVGGFRPATTASSPRSSRFGRADSSPNLVSFDDVKYSTPLPERGQSESRSTTSYSATANVGGTYASTTNVGGQTVIDTTVPAPSSPAYKAAMRDGAAIGGVNSVFESTSAQGGYDPYEAYSSSTPSSYMQSRALTVVKPVVYGDVERVARAVKSGDVVVLAMRNTPDSLSKRILDFSFGVASALDANVECPGDKVFAIARGNALTEDEKHRLKLQGVL